MYGTVEADWGSTTVAAQKWPSTFTDVTSQTLGFDEPGGGDQLKRFKLPVMRKSGTTSATMAITTSTVLIDRAVDIVASSERPRVLVAFPRFTANVAISEPREDQFTAIKVAFLVGASRIPRSIFPAVRERFTELMGRLLDDDDDAPELSRESLSYALKFLERAWPKMAPSFSVTSTGDIYLQWINKPTESIAGITFRGNGQAVWSASGQNPHNPATRDAAAGTTFTAELRDKLKPHAEWIF